MKWIAAAVLGVLAIAVAGALAVASVLDDPNSTYGETMHRVARSGESELGDRSPSGRHGPMAGPMASAFRQTEAEFLTEMVAHHEEAVVAARELRRSARPELRALGASIVESQSRQIATMREWLERWYPDEEPSYYRPMMRDLAPLSGDELDRTFLEDMVRHHMAAVMMSEHLLRSDRALHSEVAGLARTISREQRAEIRTMSGWLAAWFEMIGCPFMAMR